MKNHSLLMLIVLATPLTFLAGACGQKNSSRLDIVGGRVVTADETGPERVSTVGLSGCTGTIIARDLILTAAHCYDNSIQGGYVLFGTEFAGSDRKIIRIEAATVNPAYAGPYNDVAMLKLAQDIPAGYQPAKLLPPELALSPGDGVRQAGYGVDNTPDSFGTLRTVDSQFVGLTSSGAMAIQNGTTAACSGDSGGPLYVQKNGQWYTSGITSTAYMDAARRCTGGNQYTSVSLQYNLIVEMARKLTGRDNPFEAPTTSKPAPGDVTGTPNNPATFEVLGLTQTGDVLSLRLRNVTGRAVANCEFTVTPTRNFYNFYAVTYDLVASVTLTAKDAEIVLPFTDPYEGRSYLSAIQGYEVKKTCLE